MTSKKPLSPAIGCHDRLFQIHRHADEPERTGRPFDRFEEMADKCVFPRKRTIGGFQILKRDDVFKYFGMAKGE
jgi:hypothetical protein